MQLQSLVGGDFLKIRRFTKVEKYVFLQCALTELHAIDNCVVVV